MMIVVTNHNIMQRDSVNGRLELNGTESESSKRFKRWLVGVWVVYEVCFGQIGFETFQMVLEL